MKKSKLSQGMIEARRKYAREYMRKYLAKKRDQKNRERMVEEVLAQLKKVILAA